jgi:hypothetical protein
MNTANDFNDNVYNGMLDIAYSDNYHDFGDNFYIKDVNYMHKNSYNKILNENDTLKKYLIHESLPVNDSIYSFLNTYQILSFFCNKQKSTYYVNVLNNKYNVSTVEKLDNNHYLCCDMTSKTSIKEILSNLGMSLCVNLGTKYDPLDGHGNVNNIENANLLNNILKEETNDNNMCEYLDIEEKTYTNNKEYKHEIPKMFLSKYKQHINYIRDDNGNEKITLHVNNGINIFILPKEFATNFNNGTPLSNYTDQYNYLKKNNIIKVFKKSKFLLNLYKIINFLESPDKTDIKQCMDKYTQRGFKDEFKKLVLTDIPKEILEIFINNLFKASGERNKVSVLKSIKQKKEEEKNKIIAQIILEIKKLKPPEFDEYLSSNELRDLSNEDEDQNIILNLKFNAKRLGDAYQSIYCKRLNSEARSQKKEKKFVFYSEDRLAVLNALAYGCQYVITYSFGNYLFFENIEDNNEDIINEYEKKIEKQPTIVPKSSRNTGTTSIQPSKRPKQNTITGGGHANNSKTLKHINVIGGDPKINIRSRTRRRNATRRKYPKTQIQKARTKEQIFKNILFNISNCSTTHLQFYTDELFDIKFSDKSSFTNFVKSKENTITDIQSPDFKIDEGNLSLIEKFVIDVEKLLTVEITNKVFTDIDNNLYQAFIYDADGFVKKYFDIVDMYEINNLKSKIAKILLEKQKIYDTTTANNTELNEKINTLKKELDITETNTGISFKSTTGQLQFVTDRT